MSKNYSQTGIGSPVEVTKGGPLIRNNAGVLENRNNADSAFSIMRGAPAVGNDDFVTLAQVGGGGGITAGANVGAGTGDVFRDITGGTTFNLRTLLSPTGTVSIVTNGDVVEIESASDTVTSSTFTDSGVALEFTLAAVASVSQVISRVSTRNTTSGNNESVSYEIIVTSDGTTISGSTDIVQVDGPTPLTTLALSVVDNAGNINLRFTRTGVGDTIQLHFASSTLPI